MKFDSDKIFKLVSLVLGGNGFSIKNNLIIDCFYIPNYAAPVLLTVCGIERQQSAGRTFFELKMSNRVTKCFAKLRRSIPGTHTTYIIYRTLFLNIDMGHADLKLSAT